MKRLILAALLIAAPVFAQEDQTKKLIKIQYADPIAVANMIRVFGVGAMANNEMKAITITGKANEIAAAEAAIKQLDVAPKNIELVVYFVVGSDRPDLAGTAVPTDVRD